MATLNRSRVGTASRNHEGSPVTPRSSMQELRRAVLACLLWEDGFYEDGQAIAKRIDSLVAQQTPEDVAALAIEARTAQKLRHLPLHLAVLLARRDAGRRVLGKLLPAIIQRADELTEFLALYWHPAKVPLAKQVKTGLAAAFQRFGAYDLAKYDRDSKAIRLRDVLFLCHAKPKDEAQAALWKQLVDGTLPTPDTWETELSGGKDKRATWERLMAEKKLGALALLRNLRNMQQAGVPNSAITAALASMKTDRVLPFRFIAAAVHAPQLEPALEQAMFRCLGDMPKLGGKTALVIDTSPSMWMANVSSRSEMTRFDAAAALAMLIREIAQDVQVYAFNQQAYSLPPRRGFALRDALLATKDGASMGGLAVEQANRDGYDRLVVLTDGEWHMSVTGGGAGPALQVSPPPLTAKAYMVNVAQTRNGVGYGKWTSIDGWSEAIVEFIQAYETPYEG